MGNGRAAKRKLKADLDPYDEGVDSDCGPSPKVPKPTCSAPDTPTRHPAPAQEIVFEKVDIQVL